MHRQGPKTILPPRPLVAIALLALATALPGGACAREGAVASQGDVPGTELSAAQARAVALLLGSRPADPAPLFLFTDPNKDPDDLSVLVLASELQGQGFVDLRCVVTTLGDRETRLKRARFAKDVLEDLGLEEAKVGVGVDYGIEVKDDDGTPDVEATEGRRKDHQVFIDSPFGQPRGAVAADGLVLLEGELAQVPDRSAVLLVDAGMADLAALLRSAPGLVGQKTAKVVIMGGVDPQVDERGFVSADERANANPLEFESVWGQVTRFNLYDPLALFAATPGVGERLFRPDVFPSTQSDVEVIGEDSVKDPVLVRDLLSGMAVQGLSP